MPNVESYPMFRQTFTLKMATAMFAKKMDNFQHLTQLIPESQSFTN
jgi:hypothetical protein